MIAYERKIHIDALPAAVWPVIAEVEKWPAWTPTVLNVAREDTGPFAVGSSARVTQKTRPEAVWRVTELVPGRSFAWETRSGPGLRVAGDHIVEPDGAGSLVTLAIIALGPASPLMGWLVGRMSKSNVDLEAESLKRHVEQLAGNA